MGSGVHENEEKGGDEKLIWMKKLQGNSKRVKEKRGKVITAQEEMQAHSRETSFAVVGFFPPNFGSYYISF